MNSPVKRAWKLQDFMAHGASVNCLALGKKSGRVLATGGDDKKVNLWALGKSSCIMSLSGHSTPVESVQFGHGEETLSAGCQSGAIKIWNLAESKVLRTLNGHKATITSVDFHPYGDHLCSGSLDSFIKLWDLRKKGCIYTYRGHSKRINSIKYSPDGQWVASGGEDGVVRIWDLRVGKRISDLTNHSAPVTDVVFHPNDFLLASSSADRTVNVWDLDKFSLTSTTEKNSSTIRRLTFSQNGECLLGGDSEGLKVYGWEPARQYDAQPMGWGKVQDLVVHETQLIGASFHLTNASIHVIDLSLVHPLGKPPPQYSSYASSVPFSHNTTLRKSFTKRKPETKTQIAVKPIEENVETDPEEETFATIPNVSDYSAIFRPHRSLNRSPNRLTPSLNSDDDWIAPPKTQFFPPESPIESTPPLSYSSTPPLSPIRPQRKLSSHRPPPLAMMNPQELSSPEHEVPPKIPSDFNLSKLYISTPSSRNSSRTGSPRRAPLPASPSYSSGSLDAASTSYNYNSVNPSSPPTHMNDTFHRKPIERDVEEHNYVSPFGKEKPPQVDFEVPTKENEDVRYLGYPKKQADLDSHSYTPTKDNDYSNLNLYSDIDTKRYPDIDSSRYLAQDNSTNSVIMLNEMSEPSRYRMKSNDTNTQYNTPKENENELYLSKNMQGSQHNISRDNINSNSSRFRDYFRPDSVGFPVSSASQDRELYNGGPQSMFSTSKNTDSGFSTLDSYSTNSPMNTIPRDQEVGTRNDADQIIPMNLSAPIGLDMEQFLPKSYQTHVGKPSMTEAELLSTIFNGHEKMMAVLRNRQRSLNLVFMAINNKDINAGVETALSINDGTVMIDLLKSIIPKRNIWNLELCSTILPVIHDLLQSKYEMYITAACDTLNLIMRTFGPVIKNNMKWSSSSIGVDITREDRYKKCVKVYNALMPVKALLLKKQTVQGKLGQMYRDLLSELESIDL